jgi:hypothetical protein
MAAHDSLEVALAPDGDREARAYPSAAQRPGEGRSRAGTHGRRSIGSPGVGRRGFARRYPLDDSRRVERIANAARPHGAESCRGSRPASNAALFDISCQRSNLIALALQSRALSAPRLSRETAIPSFGPAVAGGPLRPGLTLSRFASGFEPLAGSAL